MWVIARLIPANLLIVVFDYIFQKEQIQMLKSQNFKFFW